MRIVLSICAGVVVAGIIGCAGPENKLARGLGNVTEVLRMGEIRRSIEQTALWDGTDSAYTLGFIRGFNRTIARTTLGAYEIVTFPLPPYTPVMTPKYKYEDLLPKYNLYPDYSIRTVDNKSWGGLKLPAQKAYPDSFHPRMYADPSYVTDTSLGFGSGDVAPFIPGSRFRIFDH
jgi:putative exosortase-associated protein (TIGR04073 family)